MRARGLVAIAAGALVVGIAVAEPPKSEPEPTPISDSPKAGGELLATMLSEARSAYLKTRDYTGTFTRQERLNGALSSEQVGEMKMRVKPVGIYVRFGRPDTVAGMEVVYTGARRGKVQFRRAGVAGRKGFLKLDVDDPTFLAEHRHPVTSWGIGPIIELIATTTAREKTLNNMVEVYTADYQFANRNVTKYEILTKRQHAFRYAARMVVFVDKETKLPVRFEAYDDPKGIAVTGDLLEAYSFSDLKFNVGLGENVFDF